MGFRVLVAVGKKGLNFCSGLVPEVAHSRACVQGVVGCHGLPCAAVWTCLFGSLGRGVVDVRRCVREKCKQETKVVGARHAPEFFNECAGLFCISAQEEPTICFCVLAQSLRWIERR